MAGHKAKINQNAGFEIKRSEPANDKPITLTLIFGNPNNEATRRMMIQVAPGARVDVTAGTFPLTVIRDE